MPSRNEFEQLRECIYRLMDNYSNVYLQVTRNEDYKNNFRDLIRNDIPDLLKRCSGLEEPPYKIKGNYGGKPRWTICPWISVFDTRITSSAQKGVYIVYLLNKDKKVLYLTLNQGTTEFLKSPSDEKKAFTGIAKHIPEEVKNRIKSSASYIREQIKNSTFEYDDEIDTGVEGYDAGTIFYKKYTLDTLPEGEVIINDLLEMVGLYAQYYDLYEKNKESSLPENGDNEMSNKEVIEQIKSYVASKGFYYDDGLIENFYLSLKSKPFVILAGTSGTGKTRLVKLFAEAIDAKYKMVAVRPDWSDSSDLFGHVDLNGKFVPGAILDFISEADKDPNKPYILCLDEMNLARVEYYFSDFLSVIETRDLMGEDIVSDPLISLEKYGSDEAAKEKYGEIGFPQNLYLVGTVNMDETTFPFSKKVLDRANTIEFNYVDLLPKDIEFEEVDRLSLPNSFLKTEYLLLTHCAKENDFVRDISFELQELNEILQKANAQVGYRVRDEIVFYMLNNKKTELLNKNEAFDNEIMQKILPRIQGSSSFIKEMLCELFELFAGDYEGNQTQNNDIASKMMAKIKENNARYPKSAEKVAFMVRRFEEDGFTSYWL